MARYTFIQVEEAFAQEGYVLVKLSKGYACQTTAAYYDTRFDYVGYKECFKVLTDAMDWLAANPLPEVEEEAPAAEEQKPEAIEEQTEMETDTLLQDLGFDASALTHELFTNGGFSFWFDGDKNKNIGFSVGNNNFSYKVPNVRYASEQGVEYVEEAIQTFAKYVVYLTGFDGIGGWLDTDTNTLYIDPIVNVRDLEDAVDLALENKELAIYGLYSKRCSNIYGKDDTRIDDDAAYVDETTYFISKKHIWYTVRTLEGDIAIGFVPDYTF